MGYRGIERGVHTELSITGISTPVGTLAELVVGCQHQRGCLYGAGIAGGPSGGGAPSFLFSPKGEEREEPREPTKATERAKRRKRADRPKEGSANFLDDVSTGSVRVGTRGPRHRPKGTDEKSRCRGEWGGANAEPWRDLAKTTIPAIFGGIRGLPAERRTGKPTRATRVNMLVSGGDTETETSTVHLRMSSPKNESVRPTLHARWPPRRRPGR
jgi:hypothetical protein